MATTVNAAIDQVLRRLDEANDSGVAELPSGTGSGSPTIDSNDQIARHLSEGARELVRIGALTLYGRGTVTPAEGDRRVLYSALTMASSGQRFHRPTAASWNAAPVQVCDRRWYEVHNPTIASDDNAPVERIYPEEDGVLLAPRPSVAQQLALEGLVYPRDLEVGGNCDDVPDHLVPAIVVYAARVVALSLNEDRYRTLADALATEWADMTGQRNRQ